MIYHPSLTYFARDYELYQLAIELGGQNPFTLPYERTDRPGQGTSDLHHFQSRWSSTGKMQRFLPVRLAPKSQTVNPLDPDWPSQMMYIATKLKEQW